MTATGALRSLLSTAAAPERRGIELARASIARGSKSFVLASTLLPARVRRDATVLYAFCRAVDDAIDGASPEHQPAALAELWSQLDAVYAACAPRNELLAAFQALVQRRGIPRLYIEELLLGMAMDVDGMRYQALTDLLKYCYRVAGTVGLMMCHVMGVRQKSALVHAAHLGMAMQLTNIARDVREDWERGRLYLPDELLAACGATDLPSRLGGPLPEDAGPALSRATDALLQVADAYYRSGDAGLPHLSPRCAFGVRSARLVYSRIGRVLLERRCDPFAGRAVVSLPVKLGLAVRAGVQTLLAPWAPGALWPRALFGAPGALLPLGEALGLREPP